MGNVKNNFWTKLWDVGRMRAQAVMNLFLPSTCVEAPSGPITVTQYLAQLLICMLPNCGA